MIQCEDTGRVHSLLSASVLAIFCVAAAGKLVHAQEDADSEVLPAITSLYAATPTGYDFYNVFNAKAADSTNANELRPGEAAGLNLTGAGVRIGVWDAGDVRASHENFRVGAVTIVDSVGFDDHATHVAGTIVGDGTPVAAARGMASDGLGASGPTIRSRDFHDDTTEMATDVAVLDLSNHSYGLIRGWEGPGLERFTECIAGNREWWYGNYDISSTEDHSFGSYSNISVAVDEVIHEGNNLLLSVWSAGNDRGDVYLDVGETNQWVGYFNSVPVGAVCQETGVVNEAGFYVVPNEGTTVVPLADGDGGTGYDSIPNGGQTAKNVLVVGAMLDHSTDPHDGTTMTLAAFSSFGGTDDGRLAPHVVGNGFLLTSSTAATDSDYASYSGTSMSSPNVTGTAALLLEHWGNEGLTNPTAAAQKGLLVHTATDVTKGPANPGPDYATGYGMVNGRAAADFITEALTKSVEVRKEHFHQERLSDGATHLKTFQATGGPVKATLVWTDPPGTARTVTDDLTSVLVNDLDLRIESTSTFFPWSLDLNIPANSAVRTGKNNVDNIEQVVIDNLSAGTTFTVIVDHDTALINPQEFSLLVSGALVPEPAGVVLVIIASVSLLFLARPWCRCAVS